VLVDDRGARHADELARHLRQLQRRRGALRVVERLVHFVDHDQCVPSTRQEHVESATRLVVFCKGHAVRRRVAHHAQTVRVLGHPLVCVEQTKPTASISISTSISICIRVGIEAKRPEFVHNGLRGGGG
jgi:hypothetical protein